MHAQRFHAGIARGAVLFSHKSVLFAKFHQCLDMLGDKGDRRQKDMLFILAGALDRLFGGRPDPFERTDARLKADLMVFDSDAL